MKTTLRPAPSDILALALIGALVKQRKAIESKPVGALTQQDIKAWRRIKEAHKLIN